MQIDREDIVAYRVGEETVCLECASAEEKEFCIHSSALLVLKEEVEDDEDELFFCDRCNMLIE